MAAVAIRNALLKIYWLGFVIVFCDVAHDLGGIIDLIVVVCSSCYFDMSWIVVNLRTLSIISQSNETMGIAPSYSTSLPPRLAPVKDSSVCNPQKYKSGLLPCPVSPITPLGDPAAMES